MEKYLFFLLLTSTLMTTSRSFSSRGSEQIKQPQAGFPQRIPREINEYPDEDGSWEGAYSGPVIAVGNNKSANLDVTPGDFAHQVSLQDTNKQNMHFCTASIIHPRFLLSAAHCFEKRNVSSIRAVAGAQNLTVLDGNREQIRNVIRLILHNDYNKQTLDNDIALLELNEPLDFDGTHVRPIPIRDSKWPLPQRANVSVWATGSQERLMATEREFVSRGKCQSMHESNTITSSMICARGSGDTCEGNPGGSLTCSKDLANGQELRYLCGILSWGADCNSTASSDYPDVYTDVSKYEEWMLKHIPVSILFGTEHSEGIRAYTESTSDLRTVITKSEDLEGLTFDWIHRKIYYASHDRIYASNESGPGYQTVFETAEYGFIRGLAFDWITMNLYGVSWNGHVFVCQAPGENGELNCRNLLTGQGTLNGIAVDPNNGEMYWTRCSRFGYITRAQMDGSDVVQIVKGLNCPAGIAIDYDASRIFWTEMAGDKIQSSNLDGTDVHPLVKLPSGTEPWGIALHGDRMYWGSWNGKKVQRSSKSGQNVHTVFTEKRPIQQLTTTRWNYPITRPNHCKLQMCPNICVLTMTAARCIA